MQITPSLATGGGEIFSFHLSEALVRRGHDVMLLSICEPDKTSILYDLLDGVSFEFVSLGKTNGGGFSPSIPFKIRSMVRSWKPDIVNTHLRALAYSVLLTNSKIGKFHTIHNLAEKEEGAHLRRLYGLQVRMGWNQIAISESVRDSGLRVYGRAAPIIDNGVETPITKSHGELGIRRTLGIKDSENVIVCVGQLSPIKNQLGLIKSFVTLVGKMPGLHLLLVGKDKSAGEPYLAQIKKEISSIDASTARNIHLLGLRSDIGAILDSSDVFVMKSVYEGLPLALLEAMALGKKCVCTSVGGIPDALDASNGWLAKSDDEDTFLKCLEEAIGDGSKQKSKAAKTTFERRFSMAICAKKYEALYQLTRANS
jgi:glycosyltransferase involved in cell wall biosynthesis